MLLSLVLFIPKTSTKGDGLAWQISAHPHTDQSAQRLPFWPRYDEDRTAKGGHYETTMVGSNCLAPGTMPPFPRSRQPDGVERHCFGLLWCNEQSANQRQRMGCYGSIRLRSEIAILGWLCGRCTPWRKIRRTICSGVAFSGHWGPMNAEETRPGPMSSPSIGTLISRARSGPSLSRSI